MTKKADLFDQLNMRSALALARRGLGSVAPNPAVGCIIVQGKGTDAQIAGRGWTQAGGRPHAETEALARAGVRARGGTAYVTLEPCDHQGKTPPCSQALIDAEIKRVVIATNDPDPRVAGRGIARLQSAGIKITSGICEPQAKSINAGFFLKVNDNRPLFTLKTATSLDGKIATHKGQSHWITGDIARAHGHRLRAEHDAILIGIGTALADNPSLTCRLPGLTHKSPIRIVLDSTLRLNLDSLLASTAEDHPTWLITLKGGSSKTIDGLLDKGVRVIEADPGPDGRIDLDRLAGELARNGLTRVLIEGGGAVSASFLRAGLVDRIAWFRSPRLIGNDGIDAIAGLGVDTVDDGPLFKRVKITELGTDLLECFERKA